MERPPARDRARDRDRSRDRTTHDDSRRDARSPSPHSRRRDRSRSRSPRRRSRSPRNRRSPSRSVSPSHKRDSGRERHERRRGRSASRSRSRDSERRPRRDRSRERRRRSRSSSGSGSDSDDSEYKRRKRRKEKQKKRSGSKERERKERKKSKKEKKKQKNSAAVSHQWGKYGIINESDLYNKEQEFRAWLVEERKINPETTSKEQTKKEFARFVEDYNTATLPHEKFYHMEEYERRMAALRAGEYLPPASDSYDPTADMRAHQSTHKRRAVERDTYMSKEQLMELRRVQNERIEAGKMKLLGMDIKQNMGVRMDGTMFDG
ncbi:uncharacterized protein TRAVEDRAFT_173503 [Trametes versicolor FP-101664 SS1]|uniref:uncharacterized protein n=1 Tax=Trametes versicolor (strain FP-101664) TaxID=717944 RepID=UPI0004621CD8|nr:uncharacterized protein TRAVEDRAFT_173503 [Trametes versicolor FP-101664 SS1]EIW54299.1 hypothetical protein TRAVEDRAFT_173503 [Trametes versicolor FP-101664 SS1]